MSPFLLWLGQNLGQWPPPAPVSVSGSDARVVPGWDGLVRPVVGVLAPGLGTQVSVPPAAVEAVGRLGVPDVADPGWLDAVAGVAGMGPIARRWSDRTVLRWLDPGAALPDWPDEGEWVPADDPRVPGWLRPFNGGVLAAWGEDGAYLAGVGVKVHADRCHEIAVGTEPAARGKGLARRLVATAAGRILDGNAAVLYLHHKDNAASATVAEAVGFPDLGWRMCGPVPRATDDDPW